MPFDPAAPHPLRFRGDTERAARLLTRPEEQAAQQARARDPEPDLRRELLGTALRLTEVLAPDLVHLVAQCQATLGVPTTVETYVYPSPQFNAGCTAPDGERVYVLLSSAIVDGFDAAELGFVIGHELGHHLFAHHGIPSHRLLGGDDRAALDAELALELFAWQRCAEISADRAGLACVRQLGPAGRAMFKLTSGLAGARVTIDVDEFLRQAGDLAAVESTPAAEAQRRDWLTTHPFSPLRVRAMQLVSEARGFGGQRPLDQVDAEVDQLLTVMEPRYTHEHSEAGEAMRRLLFAGGIAIAAAGDGITAAERTALAGFLGDDSLPAEIDVAAVRAVLAERMARVREQVPALRRHQVVRDLSVVARADGRTSAAEKAVLVEIATGIGLPASVVATALAQAERGLD